MGELRGQLLVQAIDQLDGVRTNTDDQMMFVNNATATASWPSVDLDYFLKKVVIRRQSVGTTGGRVATNSLHDVGTSLKIVCNNFHGNATAVLLHRRTCAGVSAFVVGDVAYTHQKNTGQHLRGQNDVNHVISGLNRHLYVV